MATQELTQEEMMAKIEKMEAIGMSEDEIRKALGLRDNSQQEESFEEDEDFQIDLSQYAEDAPFKQKPAKPDFFKAREKLKPFKELFQLNSDAEYTLTTPEGERKFKAKKLNVRDVMRLTSKVPKWAAYLGFNAPKMLVNEYTGEYRWTETILALAERAFGDYDSELDRPTDFSLSVIEELATLLNLKGEPEPVDFLLSCDPDEVYTAVATLIAYNQTFFLRLWNMLGPIKELVSLTSGRISSSIKRLKENQILENLEMNLSQNETSD